MESDLLAKKLIDRIMSIERDLAVIRSHYVTKEDLLVQTWRIIGAVAAMSAAVFWMARNVAPPAPAVPPTVQAAPAQAIPPAPSAPPAQR